jgi:hypothetical protein
MHLKIAACVIFAGLLLTSCVTAPIQRPRPVEPSAQVETGERERLEIVEYTRSLLGMKYLKGERGIFRNDCSGLVLGVFRNFGYEIELIESNESNSISHRLYETLETHGLVYKGRSPKRADVVFFKGTTKNSGDLVSHVGIVDEVLDDGTVKILNYTSRGVTELRMNLDFPHVHQDESGVVKNDFLKKKSTQVANEELLAGELFFCYGDLLKYATL